MKANWQHHASVQEWHSSARQTSNKCLPAILYHRVLPTPKPKKAKSSSSLSSREKVTKGNGITQSHSEEPLDYISGEEVMQIYKVKKSWLYTSAKRNEIPVC